MKKNFRNLSFISTFLILTLILLVRVQVGLDLTDEMQYYGEMKGLVESGQLFSNDLFIQQTVYIIFYPIFYLYHLVYGFNGFVFFGRLLMAALSVAAFLYAYNKFRAFKFTNIASGLTALTLTFSIPYHGIFAPSYNTISQFIWIVFLLNFYAWNRNSIFFWGIITIVMFIIHPTSAVMMSALVIIRLLTEGKFRSLIELVVILLIGLLFAVKLLLYFSPPKTYLTSLIFSSGYGVGFNFFSNKWQPIMLLSIFVVFFTITLFKKYLTRINFSVAVSLFLVMAILLFLGDTNQYQGGYSFRVFCILSVLFILSYSWALSNISEENCKSISRLYWVGLSILLFASTLAITSGNGLGQSTGAMMVGLPLLLSDTSSQYKKYIGIFLVQLNMVLLLLLFLVHWSVYPYRDQPWWTPKQKIKSIPEFMLISTYSERLDFINIIKNALGPDVYGQKVLIASGFPAFYLISNARPETCMLYMHSVASEESSDALASCLKAKNPDVIFDFTVTGTGISKLIQKLYATQQFDCHKKLISANDDLTSHPKYLNYSICKKRF